ARHAEMRGHREDGRVVAPEPAQPYRTREGHEPGKVGEPGELPVLGKEAEPGGAEHGQRHAERAPSGKREHDIPQQGEPGACAAGRHAHVARGNPSACCAITLRSTSDVPEEMVTERE